MNNVYDTFLLLMNVTFVLFLYYRQKFDETTKIYSLTFTLEKFSVDIFGFYIVTIIDGKWNRTTKTYFATSNEKEAYRKENSHTRYLMTKQYTLIKPIDQVV